MGHWKIKILFCLEFIFITPYSIQINYKIIRTHLFNTMTNLKKMYFKYALHYVSNIPLNKTIVIFPLFSIIHVMFKFKFKLNYVN